VDGQVQRSAAELFVGIRQMAAACMAAPMPDPLCQEVFDATFVCQGNSIPHHLDPKSDWPHRHHTCQGLYDHVQAAHRRAEGQDWAGCLSELNHDDTRTR
jgi:hypothetical protein